MDEEDLHWVPGGCHCKDVTFEVQLHSEETAHRCNCSICTMTGFLHLIVPKSRFKLKSSDDALTCYTFNTGVARHLFCKNCGVKSYYIPRSNPDGISVNANCIDQAHLKRLRIEDFDGENWERNASKLAHLSAG